MEKLNSSIFDYIKCLYKQKEMASKVKDVFDTCLGAVPVGATEYRLNAVLVLDEGQNIVKQSVVVDADLLKRLSAVCQEYYDGYAKKFGNIDVDLHCDRWDT